MKEKNIVDLWDLPEDKVYVKIKDDVRYDFFEFIKTNYGGAKKFSDMRIQESIDKRYDTIKIKLPRIVGVILSVFFGFQNNELKHVPESIKNSSKRIKAVFLGAIFDDEGSFDKYGRKIQLEMIVKSVISDVKNMLEKDFEIKTSKVKEMEPRTSNRQKTYRFHITGIDNFHRFYSYIPIFHDAKLINLELLTVDKRKTQYRNSRGVNCG